jgi:hypothetical protein
MVLPFDLTIEIKGKHAEKLHEQIMNPKRSETRRRVLAEAREVRKLYYRE